MNKISIFNQDEIKEESLHCSICCFLNEWLRGCHFHTFNREEKLKYIERDLRNLFSEGSSGFGNQSGGTVYNYFDEEWMPDLGIEPFKNGQCFLVEYEDSDCFNNVVMYSKIELMGWISLSLSRYASLVEELKDKIMLLEEYYYSPSEVKEILRKKNTGELKWDYGPYYP